MFASKRDILTLLVRNIANSIRDLYRCVFSVKDNTLLAVLFLCRFLEFRHCAEEDGELMLVVDDRIHKRPIKGDI